MGDLILLDDYRIENEPEEPDIYDEMHIYAAHLSLEELADDAHFENFHYDYLTSTEIATLTEADVKWVIAQLIKRSDFCKSKEDALEMIEDILRQREED
jgi:hypothetical protein